MADLLARDVADQAVLGQTSRAEAPGRCPWCGEDRDLNALPGLHALVRATGTTEDDVLTLVAESAVQASDAVLLRKCGRCGLILAFSAAP